jgi:hypothetical protein
MNDMLGPHQRTIRAMALTCMGALYATSGTAGGSASPTAGPASATTTVAESTDRLIIRYKKNARGFSQATFAALARAHSTANAAGVQMHALRKTGDDAHVMQLDRRVDLVTL